MMALPENNLRIADKLSFNFRNATSAASRQQKKKKNKDVPYGSNDMKLDVQGTHHLQMAGGLSMRELAQPEAPKNQEFTRPKLEIEHSENRLTVALAWREKAGIGHDCPLALC